MPKTNKPINKQKTKSKREGLYLTSSTVGFTDGKDLLKFAEGWEP